MNSYFGWMGFRDEAGDTEFRRMLDQMYLGVKHFRFPPENAHIMPSVFSDDELGSLPMPVLLLIRENEGIYEAAKALDRAHRIIRNIEGALVPDCRHDMSARRNRFVNRRVLDFLNDSRSN